MGVRKVWIGGLLLAVCGGMAWGQTAPVTEKKTDKVATSVEPPKVDSGVTAPVVLYAPEAQWPENAKGKHERAADMKRGLFHKGKPLVINVTAIVGPDGLIQSAQIDKPEYQDFDANALATVKTYRFKPAMKNGQPVVVKIIVQVAYTAHAH